MKMKSLFVVVVVVIIEENKERGSIGISSIDLVLLFFEDFFLHMRCIKSK
jgi:hypothetical protein